MKVKFSRCNSNSLADVPFVDGQLIYVKDTHELYIDAGTERNLIAGKAEEIEFDPTETTEIEATTVQDAVVEVNNKVEEAKEQIETINNTIGSLNTALDLLNGEVI